MFQIEINHGTDVFTKAAKSVVKFAKSRAVQATFALAAFLGTTALTGCKNLSFTAPCNSGPCQTTNNPQPKVTCNDAIVSATSDLNNTSLSPLDANGNPMPSLGVVNGSIATMISTCKLPSWDGTNPQNWSAGKEALTIYKPKGGSASFVDATTTSYENISGDPSIRVDSMDLPVSGSTVAVNTSAYDHFGDTGQNRAALTAPLQPSATEMTKDAAFASTNGDVWNFTGDFTARQLQYDRVLANAFGQGYAQALGGDDTTAMALQVQSIIKAATGVDINPTGGVIKFITYAQYNLGPTAIADGVYITHNNTFYTDTNPTNGSLQPIQNSGDFTIFVKSGTTYNQVDYRMNGIGIVHDMKGENFVWTTPASPVQPLQGTYLANAQAEAAGFGLTLDGTTFTQPAVVKANGEVQDVSATVTANVEKIDLTDAATANVVQQLNEFMGKDANDKSGIVIDTKPAQAAPVEAAPSPQSKLVAPRMFGGFTDAQVNAAFGIGPAPISAKVAVSNAPQFALAI